VVVQLIIDAAPKVHRETGVLVGEIGRSVSKCFGQIPPRYARERMREWRESATARKSQLRTGSDVVERKLRLAGK